MKKASKEDYKNIPMPNDFKILPKTNRTYSKDEFEKITYGLMPGAMEDKWFMYFENDILYCHRSWTGIIVYEIHFSNKNDSIGIGKIKLNHNVYKADKIIIPEHELEMALYLVDTFLLDKNTVYPIDPAVT